MAGDASINDHLDNVLRHWTREGPLEELSQLVSEVWARNWDRHDDPNGDDAMVLGIRCSRNILHLAQRRMRDVEFKDVRADGGRTLELTFDGVTMHTSKEGELDPLWGPDQIEWDASDVRLNSAVENSRAFVPAEDTLMAHLADGAMSPTVSDPSSLTRLHLAWQGLAEGRSRIWVGFPQAGESPWLAVRQLRDGGGWGNGGLTLPTSPSPSTPDHDTLAQPAVPMRRRDDAAREANPSSGTA